MKTLKKIITWSIAALLLESVMFFAIDKYYEKTLMNTKVTEVRVYKDTAPQKNITITIPSAAKKIEASFDGKYLSYYVDTNLIAVNTYNGTKHTISAEDGSQIAYSKWLPDINSMILCEQESNSKRNITLFSYDAENTNKVAPTDTNNHNLKLTLNSSSDTITNIAMSSTMGIMYIKSLKTDGKNDIFYNNVNGLTSTLYTRKDIGNISTFEHKPNLMYEDLTNSTVRITNSTWRINNKKTCLFTTDDSDNLYIGVLENGRVKEILYGSIDTSIGKLSTLTFSETENKANVFITRGGKIYINNGLKGSILDKLTGKITTYKGKLLKIVDKTILSVSNNKLLKTTLK